VRRVGRPTRFHQKRRLQDNGTTFALTAVMSGHGLSRALLDRFELIRRSEIERLSRKLRGLTADEREVVDAVTADIVRAIARMPERILAGDAPKPAVDALVQLFGL
jgi:glutamyl-tRNA reductase